jgi:hypothetical protein
LNQKIKTIDSFGYVLYLCQYCWQNIWFLFVVIVPHIRQLLIEHNTCCIRITIVERTQHFVITTELTQYTGGVDTACTTIITGFEVSNSFACLRSNTLSWLYFARNVIVFLVCTGYPTVSRKSRSCTSIVCWIGKSLKDINIRDWGNIQYLGWFVWI